MEAIIRTSDRNLFTSLLQFLKTINVSVVETTTKHSVMNNKKQYLEFDALHLKTKSVKFNREEANER